MICQVVVGRSRYKLDSDTNITDIPNAAEQSIKGLGIFAPRYKLYLNDVPAYHGPFRRNVSAKLHYSEYVVYNETQVKIEYLVKVKFNYNTPSDT